jgi:tellurite resistance protein TerC
MVQQGGEYSLATTSSTRLLSAFGPLAPGVAGRRTLGGGRDLRSHQLHIDARWVSIPAPSVWCLPEDERMDVAGSVWTITLVGLGALLLFDLAIIGRRPHEPSMRECVLWVIFYVALAGAFGLGLWAAKGAEYAGQFFAGWVTEYSLSVDNLFVFVIIMARFAVPRSAQQKVLLIGIGLALLMRGVFIALGAAAIDRFDWVFYFFGAFLVYTAVRLATNGDGDDGEYKENAVTRWTRKVLPMADRYNNAHMIIRVNGRRLLTPILVVMIAIGTTDLIFALDSIPAIFGLTQEPYLVFTANVFALMGLRQLYFLLGGLLNRLVYLSIGLSLVLGFIGVKLVLEALHANNVPFINGGQPVSWAPQVSIELSLAVIIGTLAITTVASVLKSRRTARRSLVGAAVARRAAARRDDAEE